MLTKNIFRVTILLSGKDKRMWADRMTTSYGMQSMGDAVISGGLYE